MGFRVSGWSTTSSSDPSLPSGEEREPGARQAPDASLGPWFPRPARRGLTKSETSRPGGNEQIVQRAFEPLTSDSPLVFSLFIQLSQRFQEHEAIPGVWGREGCWGRERVRE